MYCEHERWCTIYQRDDVIRDTCLFLDTDTRECILDENLHKYIVKENDNDNIGTH
jgi:hypothetical protein